MRAWRRVHLGSALFAHHRGKTGGTRPGLGPAHQRGDGTRIR